MRSLSAAIAALCLFAMPAKAGDRAFLVEMRAHDLTKWIVGRTDYKPVPPPPIVFMPQPDMDRVSKSDTIRALYFPNMIVLGANFELGRHDHMLLHELVHHLQFMSGGLTYENEACYARHELEAYGLQNQFVDETGIGQKAGPMFLVTLNCGEGW